MMVYFYDFAGISFKVCLYDGLIVTPFGILSEFETQKKECSYTVNISENDFFPHPVGECVFSSENKIVYLDGDTEYIYIGSVSNGPLGAYMYIVCNDDHNDVMIKGVKDGEIPHRNIIESMTAVHAISRNGGVLLHSSYINVNGKAILFTAPSGVGKSTQAQLWCEYEKAELINGDRSVIYPECVCGVPYCGSSGVSKNVTLPIVAIVYLSQAPTDSIEKLNGVRAFRKIWEGCCVNVWNKSDVERSVKTISDVVSSVAVYHLACTKERSAVDILKKELDI